MKWKSAAAMLLAAVTVLVLNGAAGANWLTALTKGAGKGAHHGDTNFGLGPIGRAAAHVAGLPASTRGALAAHATPEGHWQFANREGQVFTAGTPGEMARVAVALLPESARESKLSLYLSEDSVFANSAALEALPGNALLHLVTGKGAVLLGRDDSGALIAKVKPNVSLALEARQPFDDAMAFLARPLNKSNIRTLAVEPDGATGLSSAPKFDHDSKQPLVDAVDPDSIARALSSLRGQTALLVGRIDGNSITFQPSSGPEISRTLAELRSAARDYDVNLVVLHADTPRQPGGRNWFWQRIEIGGFSKAVAKATFADFVDALAARSGAMHLTAASDGHGRVQFAAVAQARGGAVESVQSTLSDWTGYVTGEIATKAIHVYARDEERDRELDARLIPGVPAYIQIPYFAGIIAGLMVWAGTWPLWQRIWPLSTRRPDQRWIVHMLTNVPNFAAFLLVFLPIAGLPAFIASMIVGLWQVVMAPIRWVGRLFRRRVNV